MTKLLIETLETMSAATSIFGGRKTIDTNTYALVNATWERVGYNYEYIVAQLEGFFKFTELTGSRIQAFPDGSGWRIGHKTTHIDKEWGWYISKDGMIRPSGKAHYLYELAFTLFSANQSYPFTFPYYFEGLKEKTPHIVADLKTVMKRMKEEDIKEGINLKNDAMRRFWWYMDEVEGGEKISFYDFIESI